MRDMTQFKREWEKDLADLKAIEPNWQQRFVGFTSFNKSLLTDHILSKYYKNVCINLFYNINIPKHLHDLDPEYRKICLAHEYGHVINNHILKSNTFLLLGVILINLFHQFSVSLLIFSIILWYMGLYKVDEKEFKADALAVKHYGKGPVVLWLQNLYKRKNVNKDGKESLKKRILRLDPNATFD